MAFCCGCTLCLLIIKHQHVSIDIVVTVAGEQVKKQCTLFKSHKAARAVDSLINM